MPAWGLIIVTTGPGLPAKKPDFHAAPGGVILADRSSITETFVRVQRFRRKDKETICDEGVDYRRSRVYWIPPV